MAARAGQAPEWASWSLFHGAAKGPSPSVPGKSATGGAIKKPDEEAEPDAGALTTLLRHDADGLTWWDFEEEPQQGTGLAGGPGLPIDADEIDKILSTVEETTEIKTESKDESDDERVTKKGAKQDPQAGPSDSQRWRFDPLSDAESTALERALRMSQYVPMDPDLGYNDDEGIIVEYKDEGKGKRGKTEKRVVKDTGKRAYRSVRGTTIAANNAARAVLQQLCTTMLPQRNFDWIVAQLAYPATDMLGISAEFLIKAEHRAVIADAQSYANGAPFPLENTAIIMHSLAKASGVEFTPGISILDPNAAGARHRGRPTKEARLRMSTQSSAVVAVFRELFPQYFTASKQDKKASVTAAVRDVASRLETLQAEQKQLEAANARVSDSPDAQSEADETSDEEDAILRDDRPSTSRSPPEEESSSARKANNKDELSIAPYEEQEIPQTIAPSGSGGLMGWLRGGKANGKVNASEANAEHDTRDDQQGVGKPNFKKKRKEDAQIVLDEEPKRIKRKKAVVIEDDDDEIEALIEIQTEDRLAKECEASSAPTASQTTRRSRRGDGSTADWKMPLPPFWARPGPSQGSSG